MPDSFERPALDADVKSVAGKVLVFMPPMYKKCVWRKPTLRNRVWCVRDKYGWRELTAVVRNGKTLHLKGETF